MAKREPFVLFDDARESGASDAQLFAAPRQTFVARRPEEVNAVLEAADAARRESGGTLAGYLSYEAGLAIEPKLAPLAARRGGAAGPFLWFGLFDGCERIAAGEVPQWLAGQAGDGPATLGPFDPQVSTADYLAAFARLQEAIRAGDIYQANLTLPLSGPARGDPLAIYAAIRPAAGAGYGGVIFDGSHWLLSFSPELFFTLNGRSAKVKPMKGTRPRGESDERDAALKGELAGSVKDKAENLMIVDLMRNDLSRVSEAGSVGVDDLFAIETYPTVHQMVSTVRSQLQPGKGAIDMLRALFPCGSITGTPKIRAMELIDEIERDARGPYCGAIGRIGAGGDGETDAAFNVAIRTIRLTPGENERGHAVLGVGGAIVADSKGMSEWRECMVKASFARRAASGFDLIETMRFDPEEGIAHLEMHLERMKASAAALDFSFDRHETRNRIQALCFELEELAKVRLLLARSGEISIETAPLPSPAGGPAQCLAVPIPVDPGDWRLGHKTTDRHFYEEALAGAKAAGASEAVFVRDDGFVTEGCISNIFVKGDKGILLTPPAAHGLLPGILRRALIEEGKAREAPLTLADLESGFLIGNALRGIREARLVRP